MTGMNKPAFPTASLIVQAAMAAAFLVGLTGAARAQAVIHQDDGGLVQWTIGMNGVSSAPGVSAVNLPQLDTTFGSQSWVTSAGGVTITQSMPASSATYVGGSLVYTPVSAKSTPVVNLYATGAGQVGTVTVTLPVAQEFFGALFNSFVSPAVNTISFYNGSTLLDMINVTSLGTYIPNATNNQYPWYPAYAAYLNVDFLGGASYTSVAFTETGGYGGGNNGFNTGLISASPAPVSLTSLTSGDAPPGPAPLPALGGTGMGLLVLAGGALRRLVRLRSCPA